MKKYHLFSGYDYYPAGGMEDYIGSFDTKEEAIAQFEKVNDGITFGVWGHIATTKDDGSLEFDITDWL